MLDMRAIRGKSDNTFLPSAIKLASSPGQNSIPPVSELASRSAQNIEGRKLFRRGERILVAVSGGLDSIVLLRVLHELAPQNSWELHVAHLNHRLRGRSSDADESFVRGVAEALKIPVITARAEVRDLAQKEKISLEMASRKARHEFLAQTAVRLKIRRVALAHHADDQVELFFLRLLRGSGAEGLAGMKARSPSPANARVELVRPLLDEPKAALREHATSMRLRFREDASNASFDFQRNRIRHELLPLLRKSYQPALERAVLRLSDIVRAEGEVVGELAQQWLAGRKALDLDLPFDDLPVAVQRRVVHQQLLKLGIAPDYYLVEELRTATGRPITTGELTVVRDGAGVVSIQQTVAFGFREGDIGIVLKKAGHADFGDKRIAWTIEPFKAGKCRGCKPGRECFDADKIGAKATLRHWRPGDRFQPIGMTSPVKLQDFFTNQKIPRERRHQLILGVTAKGDVFWVEGMRIAENFKLTDKTNRCLLWQWNRL